MRNSQSSSRKRTLALIFLFASQTVNAAVIPPARWGHVSILCGNQLFVHGGHTGVNPLTAPIGSDIYSLDISKAFNSFSVPWVQLTPGPYASFHSMGLTGPENSLLAIYGGNTSFSSETTANSLNLYNTVSGTWMSSPLKDPPRREQQAAASRLSDGTIFVFGGMIFSPSSSSSSSSSPEGSATSELWSLGGYIETGHGSTPSNSSSGTITPTATATAEITTTAAAQPIPTGITAGAAGWQKLVSPQVGSTISTTDRSFHTATLIRSNGLLVIIGGVSGGSLVSMSDILVYDTKAGTWSVQTATGATPPLRRNHVAAATSNGQIYIHGGTDLGATTYFSDVAILDTTSWSWNQPAIEGTAPTGRYSHSAVMVGNNMIVSFGLTAGGATNNIYVLDTSTNTWQSSYTPSNLAATSTKPQDWPGYKPPPVPPIITPGKNGTDQPSTPPESGKNNVLSIGSIVGGVIGVIALSAILFVVLRRNRRRQLLDNQAKIASFYESGYANQRGYQLQETYYQPTGMAFEESAPSFGKRMYWLWNGLGAAAFWRKKNERLAINRTLPHKLENREDDRESMRSLQVGPITDQDIFLDAVHRARSRIDRLSPVFTPLQQPIRMTSPTSDSESPGPVSTGIGSPLRQSCAYTDFSGYSTGDSPISALPHGRTYSDGFENSMLEMDVQMVAVPRGRLYVVNPSDEVVHGSGGGEQDSYQISPPDQYENNRPTP